MSRLAEDAATVLEARALEARAVEVLKAASYPIPVPDCSQQKHVRALVQEALREQRRALPREAAELLDAADALYFRMFLGHRGIQWRQALALTRFAPRTTQEERAGIILEGWHRAALRWNPDRGIGFCTYALSWARSALQRCDDRQSTVHLPRKSDVRGGYSFVEVISLDQPIAAGAFSPPDTREAAPNTIDYDIDLLRHREALQRALRQLTARERDILSQRFGLDGGDGVALAEIGETLGLSKERIRQIERGALEKLRSALDSRS